MSEVVEPSRYNRLVKLTSVLVAVGALNACVSMPESADQSDGQATATIDTAPEAVDGSFDVYTPNWNGDKEYRRVAQEIGPQDINRLYYAFGIPSADGSVNVDLPQAGSAQLDFIQQLQHDGTHISLSIGGYGDDQAPANEPSSREAVLAGWDTALANPKQFAVNALAARDDLAEVLQVNPAEVGIDIDEEYPAADKADEFVKLLQTLRPEVDYLTVAIPSQGNLEGFDLPAIAETVNGVNGMTYANGEDYDAQDVAADVAVLQSELGDKLSIGLATDPIEDPLINTPQDFAEIRRITKQYSKKYMAWSTEHLTRQHIEAIKAD